MVDLWKKVGLAKQKSQDWWMMEGWEKPLEGWGTVRVVVAAPEILG